MKLDDAAEWFDYWIETYSHPATALYANVWNKGPDSRRAIVATIEQGKQPRIYDIERSNA